MRDLIEQIKKTVVFLGRLDEQQRADLIATGFLIRIENVFHLVTAKHVVINPKTGKPTDEGLCVFFNLKTGGIGYRKLDDIKRQWNVQWLFHQRNDVDVAMIPFGLDPEQDDVLTIPDELFLSIDRVYELYDIFFLSYQPGLQASNRITPVVRSGSVSIVNEDKSLYIDGAAFPGNSGSPVFLKPSPIRFDKRGITIGSDLLGGKFIGIIGEYLPYREVAVSVQTGRPRVVFEENTGLSRVWSADLVREIMESPVAKKQLQKLESLQKS